MKQRTPLLSQLPFVFPWQNVLCHEVSCVLEKKPEGSEEDEALKRMRIARIIYRMTNVFCCVNTDYAVVFKEKNSMQ